MNKPIDVDPECYTPDLLDPSYEWVKELGEELTSQGIKIRLHHLILPGNKHSWCIFWYEPHHHMCQRSGILCPKFPHRDSFLIRKEKIIDRTTHATPPDSI